MVWHLVALSPDSVCTVAAADVVCIGVTVVPIVPHGDSPILMDSLLTNRNSFVPKTTDVTRQWRTTIRCKLIRTINNYTMNYQITMICIH